ncbi:electron transfer flavoprotein subunit beta [Dehalogenimonas formicexedens]|uniref:Electron transfer flavoprotein small subunit n=1 Tax=Dehalogenimonas formicexedens TaxID=1839801 RepID=A0A1P8F850_9CHLR|nr:electron transfer flavoprotein subunit beta/FixA family protein [Dehalogenimonas formicexedens]APV44651.1 electron transfer flavoprotein subunit beta [Dehalogenimonas formicexedens]
MDIIVLVKQIPDPEIPPASFKIDAATNKVVPPAGVAPVIDPYSEHALEAALRLKDANPGSVIKVLSLGANLNKELLKKALALGADELILIDDPAYADLDAPATAGVMASAVKKIVKFDIILTGRAAADWDAGQTGLLLAGSLNAPAVSHARKVEFSGGKLRVERVVSDGYDVIESAIPAVITVSSEIGKLRLPNIKGVLAAKKKEPVYWKAADLGAAPGRKVKLVRLYQPQREASCELIPGATPEEQGINLALKLRELKLI